MLAKGQITPRLVQAAFILLGDEDDEVRFPLIDLIGDLAFDETGFCRATSILPKPKEPIIKLLPATSGFHFRFPSKTGRRVFPGHN